MIDSNEKRNSQLAFELLNSHVCEKCSKNPSLTKRSHFVWKTQHMVCIVFHRAQNIDTEVLSTDEIQKIFSLDIRTDDLVVSGV